MKIRAIAVLLASCILLSAAQPALAVSEPPRPPISPESSPFDDAPDGSGHTFYSPTLDAQGVSPYFNTSEGEMTTQLDPGTIALCNAGFGDVSVQRFDDVPDLDHVDLFCGNANAGYVHIRANHQLDWTTTSTLSGAVRSGTTSWCTRWGRHCGGPSPATRTTSEMGNSATRHRS